MELASGGDLQDYMIDDGPFKEAFVKRLALQLLGVINYLSKQGLAHQDLKLENILVDKDFNLKVADFGFATKIEGNGSGL